MIWEAYPNVTYCTLTRQSSRNWGKHVKQHAFLYQLWTTGALLNILLGPPNHDSQNSPDETHELGSWAKKWDDVLWAWTMSFDAFLSKYGLFWALEEIFPKSMIVLMWCGSPMKWNHVVWKFCPQQVSSATDPIFVVGWIYSRDILYFVSLLLSIYLVVVDGFSWWGLLYDLGVANLMIPVNWDFRIWLKRCSLGLEFCILAWKKLYRLDDVR